jgi:hypothetical protein
MPGFGWLPDSNAFIGGFGVFMNFENDITEMSAQVWDNSGPATLFGGGMFLVLLNDGVEVSFNLIENPAFGGVGDSWFNITTDGGDVFDEVRFVGAGFAGPLTIMGQASWNAVPAPGAAALLGLGGSPPRVAAAPDPRSRPDAPGRPRSRAPRRPPPARGLLPHRPPGRRRTRRPPRKTRHR